jgi:hypothetical protein
MAVQDQPCSRCGGVIAQPGVSLTIQGATPDVVPEVLSLCPRCSRSFTRWETARRPPTADAAEAAHRHQRRDLRRPGTSRPRNRLEMLRRETLRNDLLAFALVMGAAAVLWMIFRPF